MNKRMKIAVLEARTLGEDIDFSVLDKFGDVTVYDTTDEYQLITRISDVDIVIVNKLKLNRENLKDAKNLKLICITATGYDNIDTNYCWQREIGVCNVKGYSTDSVAQVTFLMALELITHLREYNTTVKNGAYTKSGSPLCTTPLFHEISGLTWGIVGYGAIGRRVAQIASVFDCKVLVSTRTDREMPYDNVELDELLKKSDIVSLHIPLSDETKHLINEKHLKLMKDSAILINVARGAVVDEDAVCNAIIEKKLGGFASDVYSQEPMTIDSPYNSIVGCENVILTPHMAWAAYEARVRCIEEVSKNIATFLMGGTRNRVDL